ncbi:DUF6874 family protein [Komagataeibacter nataicola]|uniref:DUF6874 family protein n=1 Tax=Komagataeibacter nataicola TaxID=265960 RepID=UPI0011B60A16|nr:hypothetical protein [Komagataeibacter nataicola]WNM08408.1 hypothetical protein RI056_16345 [Komagataeibacter nataicola]
MSNHISFDVSDSDAGIIRAISERAAEVAYKYRPDAEFDLVSCRMDITATHANGNPLRLRELLEADDFNFGHDVFGIECHLDRTTGKLMNGFSPRFSKRGEA